MTIYWIMIIHASTKKKRQRGYTASPVRASGRPVPLKKFIEARIVSITIQLPGSYPTQTTPSTQG